MKACVIGPLCKDEIIIGSENFFQPGGVAYYTGEALTALGANTVLFSSFGNGLKPYLTGLKSEIKQIKCSKSIHFINEYPDINNPNKRFQKCYNTERVLSLKDFTNVDFNEFDYVIFGPLFHNNISPGLIKHVSRTNTSVILAAQGLIRYSENNEGVVWRNAENVINLLPFIDYLFLDEEELKFVSGNKGVDFLLKEGVRNIVVTNGMNGSRLILHGEKFNIPAFKPVKLVDPTGAGDSYMAGFIKSTSLYNNPSRMGKFAAMTATINIEKKGAFQGSEKEVIKRLKE